MDETPEACSLGRLWTQSPEWGRLEYDATKKTLEETE
jgi:hypothetical protein